MSDLSDLSDDELRAALPYEYFISYCHPQGYGRCTIGREIPIVSLEDIEAVEATLSKKNGASLALMNFILLRSPPPSPPSEAPHEGKGADTPSLAQEKQDGR